VPVHEIRSQDRDTRQEEEEQVNYSEDEIRRAVDGEVRLFKPDLTAELVIARLTKNRENAHDFADADTVTARELRDALKRLFPDGRCETCGAFFHGSDTPGDAVLTNISEHREPDCPAWSVWKDANDAIWRRTPEMKWEKFGVRVSFSDVYPKRPLRRMDVIS
jgi:hypothetical protein